MRLKYKPLNTEDTVNACLASIREDHLKKRLLKLLSRLDITISDPNKEGNGIEYKIWITNKKTKKKIYLLESRRAKIPHEVILRDIPERMRSTLNLDEDTFLDYLNAVGADDVNDIHKFDYKVLKASANWINKVVSKAEINSIPSIKLERVSSLR